jgi:hypothetical protein
VKGGLFSKKEVCSFLLFLVIPAVTVITSIYISFACYRKMFNFSFTPEEEKVYKKDQEVNPNCSYSVNNSKVCQNDEKGQFVCETIRQLQRMCPNKQPVTIYKHSNQSVQQEEEENQDIPFLFSPFGGLSSPFFGRQQPRQEQQQPFQGDPLDLAEELLNSFGFGSLFSNDSLFKNNGTNGDRRGNQQDRIDPFIPPHKVLPGAENKNEKKGLSSWLFGKKEQDKRVEEPVFKGRISGPIEEI